MAHSKLLQEPDFISLQIDVKNYLLEAGFSEEKIEQFRKDKSNKEIHEKVNEYLESYKEHFQSIRKWIYNPDDKSWGSWPVLEVCSHVKECLENPKQARACKKNINDGANEWEKAMLQQAKENTTTENGDYLDENYSDQLVKHYTEAAKKCSSTISPPFLDKIKKIKDVSFNSKSSN